MPGSDKTASNFIGQIKSKSKYLHLFHTLLVQSTHSSTVLCKSSIEWSTGREKSHLMSLATVAARRKGANNGPDAPLKQSSKLKVIMWKYMATSKAPAYKHLLISLRIRGNQTFNLSISEKNRTSSYQEKLGTISRSLSLFNYLLITHLALTLHSNSLGLSLEHSWWRKVKGREVIQP